MTQTLPDSGTGPCTVCGEQAEAGASALCNGCGELYHLVLTQDTEGKDCGEVWLNEEFLALEFGCARCLAEHRGEPASPTAGPPAAPEPGPPQQIPVKRPPVKQAPVKQAPVKQEGLSARDIVRRKRR